MMAPEILKQHISVWTEENEPIGRKLGYPQCCIDEFCSLPPALLQIMKPQERDFLKYQAACIDNKFTGFIPCYEHAKQIISGKITLQSLIQNRNSQFPEFPNV